jgi:hypothetical protein
MFHTQGRHICMFPTLGYFWITLLSSVSWSPVYKNELFFCVVSETVISGTSFLETLQNHIIIDNFQNLFNVTKNVYSTFWWNLILNSGLYTCNAGALLLKPYLLLTFKRGLGMLRQALHHFSLSDRCGPLLNILSHFLFPFMIPSMHKIYC